MTEDKSISKFPKTQAAAKEEVAAVAVDVTVAKEEATETTVEIEVETVETVANAKEVLKNAVVVLAVATNQLSKAKAAEAVNAQRQKVPVADAEEKTSAFFVKVTKCLKKLNTPFKL